MKLTRRHFFGATLAAYFTNSVGRAATTKVPPTGFSAEEFATFVAFVDTLIPADRHTPAASDLDIPRRLIDATKRTPAYIKLLKLGCRWLDRRARTVHGSVFVTLSERQKEKIVDQVAGVTAKGLPYAFFHSVRQNALTLYYARSESWAALGYDGPPQPNGFPDYHQPPMTTRR